MEKRDPMPKLPQLFPMASGDGIHSYARNSFYQRSTIEGSKETTREIISSLLDLQNPNFNLNIFKIADFGCSIGPNTFEAIQHIIETVKQTYRGENNINNLEHDLEFHVFFNDLPNNDFNTLFKNLPPNREYFIAGVPGSFYDRVFPKNSLHIGFTSNTIHWLSSAPDRFYNLNSKAYKAQFVKDMKAFLEARAEELVHGGLMIILGQCLSDGVPLGRTGSGAILDMFVGCLIDLAELGVTSEEEVNSFMMPMYIPQFSELKEVIEENGCFSIEMMKEIKYNVEAVSPLNDMIVSSCRAVYHGALVEHFGDSLVDEIFDRFAKKLLKYPIDLKVYDKNMQYVIVLKRNVL